MPEKTLNASKKNILLRFVLPVLFLSTLFFQPASALEFVDYQDYATYDFSDDFANVTVNLPTYQCRWDTYSIHYNSYIGTFKGSSFAWSVSTGNYAMFVNPFGTSFNVNSNVNDSSVDGFAIKLDDLPKDAVISSVIKISFPDANGLIHEQSSFRNYYVSGDSIVVRTDTTGNPLVSGNTFTFNNTFHREDYTGSGDGFLFALSIPDFWVRTNGAVICELEQLSISFSISGLQYQAQQSGKTNQLLEDVKAALSDQGKTLEDVLTQQGQTNDKLDKLPGEIGDEMQGVIESEKDQSKVEGNEFVDQILGALPDPSQGVLQALGALTDSMAYTGTDAVLPIPALVLPGIAGLFPETEVWGGTEFSFADYLGFLPPTLLTLVQSLFTIAIVLFCAYEIKGIVSYCLTLHESKGG